jgi:biofilm PGA synthesis N-glycosyltransferase PgaC
VISFYAGYLFFIIYILSLVFFIIGILRVSKKYYATYRAENISIIVCVRNGERSVSNILTDLQNQIYEGILEFLIIDDDSSDTTKNIIESFISLDNRFKYFNTNTSSGKLNHKKRALEVGIDNAVHNWLLFTDVDCRVKPNWASAMSKNYSNSDYVIGCSQTYESSTLVSKFQSIDFMMLMISTYASVSMNYPLACSGQNQSYKKILYKKVGGFSKIKNLLQGDDSIFLQMCNKINNVKISFSADENSYVKAKTHNKWKDFILQRIRWAGDANIMWKFNKVFYVVILSTFFANFFILYLLLSLSLISFSYLVVIKLFFELIIYYIGTIKLNISRKYISFIIWFIIQIPYIIIMGIGSFLNSYISWKDRTSNIKS